MNREQKLEVAVKAALRLRKVMYNPVTEYGLEPQIMFVPVEEIQKFDIIIEELKNGSE